MRICGDYKVTINQVSRVDTYPLPKIEDLFSALAGGKYFCTLDMSQAYLQLPLDPESQELTTIHTHKGLFKYCRLPFGVSAAPAIFQRTIESLLQGLEGVSIYLDDLLISGATKEKCLENLAKVLDRLETANLRLKKKKCSFLKRSIQFLGHTISDKGLQPTGEKVQAIRNMPNPQNITELSRFGV